MSAHSIVSNCGSQQCLSPARVFSRCMVQPLTSSAPLFCNMDRKSYSTMSIQSFWLVFLLLLYFSVPRTSQSALPHMWLVLLCVLLRVLYPRVHYRIVAPIFPHCTDSEMDEQHGRKVWMQKPPFQGHRLIHSENPVSSFHEHVQIALQGFRANTKWTVLFINTLWWP